MMENRCRIPSCGIRIINSSGYRPEMPPDICEECQAKAMFDDVQPVKADYEAVSLVPLSTATTRIVERIENGP